MRIAIPSFKRAARLRDSTLALLQRHGVPDTLIDVFVANEEEREIYAATIRCNIIVGVVGMCAIRNFMTDFYDEGEHVLFIDDDISDFIVKNGKPFDLLRFIETGFSDCVAAGLRLWGIHPVANRYFLKEKTSTDLRYIIGCFYGVINNKEIRVDLDDGEDKLRTCLYYLADGGVFRYNWIAPVTKYYVEPGGMQMSRTLERQRASGINLLERFPYLLHRKDKKNGRIEHRFFDTRKSKRARDRQ